MDAGHPVECCSWDITMGAATNVLGKLFLRSTSASSSAMPESIDHVGIIVYNRLYEYGHSGIVKCPLPRSGEDPMPQYPGCKLRKREYIGKTSKPRHEFVEWLVNVKYSEFKASNYDMITHNCLDFCKAVCKFLKVAPLQNWEKVSNWLGSHQRLADYLTRGFRVPRHLREEGRSVSLQESDTVPDAALDNPNFINNAGSNTASGINGNIIPPVGRRRRFSCFVSRDRDAGLRSTSMETLPPTYEEALLMNVRRDSAPKYEDLL